MIPQPSNRFWIQVSIFVAIAALSAGILIRGMAPTQDSGCQRSCKEESESEPTDPLPLRGYIGLMAKDLTSAEAMKLGLDANSKGALVTDLIGGASAERGGIRINDVIVKVDGEEIHGEQDLSKKVSRLPQGKKVIVLVQRNAGKIELSIRIESKAIATH